MSGIVPEPNAVALWPSWDALNRRPPLRADAGAPAYTEFGLQPSQSETSGT
ncbi:hypothetical protein HNQ49_000300 [Parapusillimonas granuli]|nr:hypothetical protein [Parapusillimonas granuli]